MTRISLRKKLPLSVLAIVWMAAACSDSGSTSPTSTAANTPVVGSVVATSSTSQTASAGAAVAVAPSVVVKDTYGSVMAGVTVRFTVPQGGGTVQVATAVTKAAGVSSSV